MKWLGGKSAKIRVLVADDHELLRVGLKKLMERTGEFEVVGEASSGDEAAVEAESTQPDVALLDIGMPRMSGIEAIEVIRRVSPKTRILMLTMFDEVSQLRSALASGASGYLVKTGSERELVRAIRAVHAGRAHIDVSLKDGALSTLVTGDTERPELSEREQQVLALIAAGFTYQQIADKLGVGIKSVQTYRERLGKKLGLETKADIVRYALDHGLIGARTESDV